MHKNKNNNLLIDLYSLYQFKLIKIFKLCSDK